MSDRKPCCQEAWEEGWLAGLKNAGEMLSFSDEHSSFRAALEERIANAVQAERAATVAWLREPGNTVHTGAAMAAHIESGYHLRDDDE